MYDNSFSGIGVRKILYKHFLTNIVRWTRYKTISNVLNKVVALVPPLRSVHDGTQANAKPLRMPPMEMTRSFSLQARSAVLVL